MESNIQNLDFKSLIPFNDSSLPKKKGTISPEKSIELEKKLLPQLLKEIEILKIRFPKGN